jgi:hypothetical protein
VHGRQLFSDLRLNWWRGRQCVVDPRCRPRFCRRRRLPMLDLAAGLGKSTSARVVDASESRWLCVTSHLIPRTICRRCDSEIRGGGAMHGYPGSVSCLTPVPSPARDHDLSAPPLPPSLLSQRDDGAWLCTVVLRIPPFGRPVGARAMFAWLSRRMRDLSRALSSLFRLTSSVIGGFI